MNFGRTKVLLETEVLDGNIPWLIGANVLERLSAKLDYGKKELVCKHTDVNERIPFYKDDNGHIRIRIRDVGK